MSSDRHVYAVMGGGSNDKVHDHTIQVPRPSHLHFDPCKAQFCDVVNGSHGVHKVFFEVHGKGKRRVLCLMGLGGTHSQWEPQLAHFGIDKGDDYTVVVLDNRGVGFSSTPGGRWKTTDFAHDALQVMKMLEWDENVHLIGLSMGGMTAQELALMAPQRFVSLSLLSTHAGGAVGTIPPPHGMKPFLKTFGSLEGYQSVEAGLELLFPVPHLDKSIDPDTAGLWGGQPAPVPLTTNRLRHGYALIRRARKYIESGNSPEISLTGVGMQLPAVITHYVSWDRLERLRSYQIETLVVSGELDNLVGFWNSRLLSESLCAKWVHFADAGHGVNEQHDKVVNKELESLFERGESRAKAAPHVVTQRKPMPPRTHPWAAFLTILVASQVVLGRIPNTFLSSKLQKLVSLVIAVGVIRRHYGGFFGA